MAILVHDRGFWITHTLEGHIFDEALCHAIGDSLERYGCRTVADFGCGPGWYVKSLGDRRFNVRGFDGNPFTSSLSQSLFGSSVRCERLDFTTPVALDTSFDCVMSLEVGEHIPTQYEGMFLDSVTAHARARVILSWAVEGQGGTGHVNCHNNDYIIERLQERGFGLDLEETRALRERASVGWFKNTLMVFARLSEPATEALFIEPERA